MEPKFILLTLLTLVVGWLFTNKPGTGQAYALAQLTGMFPRSGGFLELFTKVFLVFDKGFEDALKEVQDMGKQVTEKIKGAIEEVDKVKQENGDFKKKWEELDKGVTELRDKYDKAVKDLDEMAKKMSRPGGEGEPKRKGFGEHLAEHLEKNKEGLATLKKSRSAAGVQFETKAVGTITMANHTGGVMALTDWDAEMARPERRTPQLRSLVRVMATDKMYVAWAEKVGFGEGGADTVAETVKKPQKDLDFTENSKKVEKIAVTYKASKESLDDLPGLRAEINADGVEEINLKLDQQLLNGNGVAPNLSGIMGYAPTMSVAGTPFEGAIPKATNLDVIFVGAALIQNAFFQPNYAIVNTLDAALMSIQKDPTTGAYLAPASFTDAAGRRIGPVQVIPDPSMAQGEFLLGDFNRAVLRIREELGVQIGYENDDFTRNLVTILMEMRAVHYIKSNHVGAFRKGVFATLRTEMTPV